jgi:hypothetical protein
MRRSVIVGIFGLLALTCTPDKARAGSWCSEEMSGSGDGATNCGFSSWAQCMETARGNGGYCRRNLMPDNGPAATNPRARRQSHNRQGL